MATAKKPPAAKPAAARRLPRLRTNIVVGEDADGEHHCLYAGPSADEALATYAKLRADGGWFDVLKFTRAICSTDPSTQKYCSFPP